MLKFTKKSLAVVKIVFLIFACGMILNGVYLGATVLRLFSFVPDRQTTGTPIPAIALSPSSNDQREPAIDGSKVVWSEKVDRYWQIILFDVQDNSRHQLTSDALDHVYPSISGEIVIWLQGEPGDPGQLYGVNYATSQPLTLSVDRASQPYLAGSSLVWLGETNIDTFDTAVLFLNSETQHSETLFRSRGARLPAISSNIVVWEDWRNYNADIYGYDLLTHQEFPITVTSGNQEAPNISGQVVVWRDNRDNYEIYGCNLKTQKEFFVARAGQAVRPKVAGGFIFWDDDFKIYAYSLRSQKLFTLVADEHANIQPAMSGNSIVWTQGERPNDRYAHLQIMMGLIPIEP